MGREIRRVPANWQHPKRTCPHIPSCEGFQCYIPLFGRSYAKTAADWLKGLKKFKPSKNYQYFWEYEGNPPDKDDYIDYEQKDAPWFQVYETVSEGTPVTPAFATTEALIEYLVFKGDFWDQKRGSGPWTRENAERFIKDEYAPSMMSIPGKGILSAKDTPTAGEKLP